MYNIFMQTHKHIQYLLNIHNFVLKKKKQQKKKQQQNLPRIDDYTMSW